MGRRGKARTLIPLAALALLVAGCADPGPSDSPQASEPRPPVEPEASAPPADPAPDPYEACLAEYPELAPCRSFVWSWLDDGRAEEMLGRLAELRRDHPEDWASAYLLGFGHFQAELPGGDDEARARFEQADRLAGAAEQPTGRVQAQLMLGALAEFADGDTSKALVHYTRATEQAELADDDELRFVTAWSMATSYRQLGLYADQVEWLNRALGSLTEDSHSGNRLTVLYALGNVYRKLGDWRTSTRYLEEHLAAAVAAGETREEVYGLQLLGNVVMDRVPEAAIPWFERCASRANAAAEAEEADSPRQLRMRAIGRYADVLVGVAQVQSGQLDAGRARLQQTLDSSLELAAADAEQTVQGVTNLLFLAEASRLLGEPDTAAELYERTRLKSEEWSKPFFQWQASAGLAAIHLAAARYDDAVREANRGVAEVEELRGAIENEGQRVYFLRQRSNVYSLLASALAGPAGEVTDEVLDAIERVHSRTLREQLAELLDQGTAAESPSLAALQRRLAEGDLLLEYLLGEDETLLLALTASTARLHRLPGRSSVEQAVERYRSVVQRPLVSVDARLDPEADYRRLASRGHELYEMLVGPAADQVARAQRLFVVPDKQLHRLAFETLPVAGVAKGQPIRFLGASHEIEYLPSASFLLDAAARREGGVVILSAGEGRSELGLAELTQAQAEVDSIRGSYASSAVRLLEGESATREGLREAIAGGASALHVVGHALLDPVQGPQVVLPGSGTDDYNLLGAAEIVDLAPTPPLVVLSACQTGEGELVGGEGILGLVRAFRMAGSSQVVATLWKADDAAAAGLMGAFHRHLRDGSRPGEALALARREMLDDGFVHPFRWGAFVLYGAD